MVEFALILPVILLLLFGLIDFGKAFTMWIDETHLASAAARYAAVDKYNGTAVDADVTAFEDAIEADGDTQELRDSFAETGNGVNVCLPAGSGGQIGDPIRVDVKATYRFLDFLSGMVPSLTADKSLTAHSVMRIEANYSPAFIADPANDC